IQQGAAAEDEGAAWLAEIGDRLAEWTYGDHPSEGLPHVVGDLLAAHDLTMAVAESCTGGLVSAALTDVPGASGWFLEGAVTYANEAKMNRLGVSDSLLRAHGAVSEPVAIAMARGARDQSGSDIAVAITGIAGPGGGSPDKPVGTVHFAVSSDQGEVHLRRNYPYADRARNRRISTWQALDLLRIHLLRHHT
ncbi:MAG: nicotinamide-nucleotide amidohydrolase family protein, partial [Myxococcota bacterium]|nr:nicotinamide-nucleotide amidohydrolase family protein [Myxococcota bacterium]